MISLFTGIVFSLSFIGLLIGSMTDIKTREVPDSLTFGLIATGFCLALLASIVYTDISYVIASLLGFIVCFGFSCLMFYTGQWGGGDAKMLMAMGSLFGLPYSEVLSFFVSFTPVPFLFIFLVLIFLVGGIYGSCWLCVLVIRNWHQVVSAYAQALRDPRNVLVHRTMLVFIAVFVLFVIFSDTFMLRVLAISLAVLFVMFYYGFLLIKVVEGIAFIKKIPLSQLTEGDWVAEDVVVKGVVLVSHKDHGVTRDQLRTMKQKNVKHVMAKYGIPFVPSFFIAFVVAVVIYVF
jgi:Flp pilus assembly protein protease CpaA